MNEAVSKAIGMINKGYQTLMLYPDDFDFSPPSSHRRENILIVFCSVHVHTRERFLALSLIKYFAPIPLRSVNKNLKKKISSIKGVLINA